MADLKVSISEDLTLNGVQQGGFKTLTITGINEVIKRQVQCEHSNNTALVKFDSAETDAANAIDVEETRYIRISNLDSTNAVAIACVGVSDSFTVILKAGESFILGTPDDFMRGEADTSPGFGSYEDLDTILARPTTSNHIRVAVFVATV